MYLGRPFFAASNINNKNKFLTLKLISVHNQGTYKEIREMGRIRKQLLPSVRKPTNDENCDLMKELAEMP